MINQLIRGFYSSLELHPIITLFPNNSWVRKEIKSLKPGDLSFSIEDGIRALGVLYH